MLLHSTYGYSRTVQVWYVPAQSGFASKVGLSRPDRRFRRDAGDPVRRRRRLHRVGHAAGQGEQRRAEQLHPSGGPGPDLGQGQARIQDGVGYAPPADRRPRPGRHQWDLRLRAQRDRQSGRHRHHRKFLRQFPARPAGFGQRRRHAGAGRQHSLRVLRLLFPGQLEGQYQADSQSGIALRDSGQLVRADHGRRSR